MNRKSNPNSNSADSQNQSSQKFLEIYEKMLNDSWSFASKMADSIKPDKKKPKNHGRVS